MADEPPKRREAIEFALIKPMIPPIRRRAL